MFTQESLHTLVEDYRAIVRIYANALHQLPQHIDLVDLCALRRWIDRQDLTTEYLTFLKQADDLVQQRPELHAGIERALRDLKNHS